MDRLRRLLSSFVMLLAIVSFTLVPSGALAQQPSRDDAIGSIGLSGSPTGVSVRDGMVWVTEVTDTGAQAERINPQTNRAVATVPVGAFPVRVAVDGHAVWVTNFDDNTVSRINPATNTVVATVQVGAPPPVFRGLGAGQGAVWVTNGDNSVSRINTATNRVVATVHIDNCCDGEVAVDPNAVWISNHITSSVTRINPHTNQVVATIEVPSAFGIGVLGHAVWVVGTTDAGGVLSQINSATNSLTRTIPLDGFLGALATGDGSVWVPSFDLELLFRLHPPSE